MLRCNETVPVMSTRPSLFVVLCWTWCFMNAVHWFCCLFYCRRGVLLYILYSYYFIMAIVHSSLSFGCYSFFSGAVSLYQPTVSTNQLVLQCIITLGTSYFVRIFINLMLPAFSKSAHGGEFPSSDATLLKGCTGNEDSQASRRTRIPSFSSPHPNYPKKVAFVCASFPLLTTA